MPKTESFLTIVMYHYIRDLKNSAYPEIKGLDTALFCEQLEYLSRHYTCIDPKDLMSGAKLPPRAALLTFDDGYRDHYETVFPLLREHGIKGVFAPVVDACAKGRVLDVNKIHFILASVPNANTLVRAIDAYLVAHNELGIRGPEYRASMVKRRFDTIEISYIKDILQKALPLDARIPLIDELFTRHVSADEADFAASLYMNNAELRELREAGMSLSVHGSTHRWFSSLEPEEQEQEICESIRFLEGLGVAEEEISITYPYGDYTDETLAIARRYGIRLGFTVRQACARLPGDERLTLPRFDTNDIPKKRDA